MSNFLQGVNLYLIGMMGSGKTTVGRLLAERLGYQFFDTDAVIEQLTQRSVAQLFAEFGEEYFRDLESQVLAELSAYTRLAIATGGGIVLRRMNWSHLRDGVIVWLDVPVDQLQARLQSDTNRPLLHNADLPTRLATLIGDRHHLYAQADARVIWQTGDSPTQIAERAIAQIQQVLKPVPLPLSSAQSAE